MSDSLITKKALAFGMKELTRKKSFNKITINDITEICGLNRQTFYYHFHDKYELLDWIFYNELITFIKEDLTYDNWDKKVFAMLTHMKKEEYFYGNTLKNSYENGFKDYLFRIASDLFLNIIDNIIVGEVQIKIEQKNFFADFFAYGTVGLIIAWAQHGMKETPEFLATQLKSLSEGTKKFAATRYLERNSQ